MPVISKSVISKLDFSTQLLSSYHCTYLPPPLSCFIGISTSAWPKLYFQSTSSVLLISVNDNTIHPVAHAKNQVVLHYFPYPYAQHMDPSVHMLGQLSCYNTIQIFISITLVQTTTSSSLDCYGPLLTLLIPSP